MTQILPVVDLHVVDDEQYRYFWDVDNKGVRKRSASTTMGSSTHSTLTPVALGKDVEDLT